MNIEQEKVILALAFREGIAFDEAADHYMLYGTGEAAQRVEERARWNAAVDAKKMSTTSR